MKKLLFLMAAGMLVMGFNMTAFATDYYVYSTFNPGGDGGAYGVDGFVEDGVDKIIFHQWDNTAGKNIAYIYSVTIPEGEDPNTHPDNPEAPGDVAERTFTFDRSFALDSADASWFQWGGLHDVEWYVGTDGFYLGGTHGVVKFDFDGNFVGTVISATPPGWTQSLAFDGVDTWYAGEISNETVYKYTVGISTEWEVAFTDPNIGPHHDGMEYVSGHLFATNYLGDQIFQYLTDGTLVDTYDYFDPISSEVEGMGFGALTHFWVGSHNGVILEIGGGALQQALEIEIPIDIKPTSCRNPLNVKSKGVLPAAILGTEDFDVTQVDLTTVQLEGVAPIRSSLKDVATPFDPFIGKEDAFDCTEEGTDGFLDLTLKFNRQEIVEASGETEDGEVLVLTLTGNLLEEFGGTSIRGEDVIVILKK